MRNVVSQRVVQGHHVQNPFDQGKMPWPVEVVAETSNQMLVRGLQLHSMDMEVTKEELKFSRQELERTLLLYKELYDLAPIGYLTLDQNQVIREINAAGSRLFGAERQSLLGKSFLLWVEKESHDSYKQHHQHVFERGECRTCKLKLLKKDRSFFHAEIECRAIPDTKLNLPYFMVIVSDISERIAAEIKLQEMNTVLKVLLKQREEDRIEMEKAVVSNIQKLVMPYLDRLKQVIVKEDQVQYLQLIKTNIENVISPFLQSLSIRYDDLTPREIEIANLVKDGRTCKEIASLLFISTRSVEFHKDNIRKKMGLTNQAIGLQSYLTSLSLKKASG